MRILLYFITISCLFYSGCQKIKRAKDNHKKQREAIESYEKNFSVVPDDKKIELLIDSVSSSTYRVYISIINHLNEEVYIGDKYNVEYYNDSLDIWENVLPPCTDYLLSSRIILPFDTINQTINFKYRKKGNFRITKFAEHTSNGNSVEILLVGEFVYKGPAFE